MPTRVPPAVTQLLAPLPAETAELVLAVRRMVLETLPKVLEVADAKARVVGYGYGSGYKDTVATLILSKAGVKLGIVRGAHLNDPDRLLAGEGKVHRHIQFRTLAEVRRPAARALLARALAAYRQQPGAKG
jgi:hypothetical protein